MMEAIHSRVSTRSFDGKPLSETEFSALAVMLEAAAKVETPFGNEVRLALSAAPNGATPVRMGTYGLISGASAYIVAAVRPGPGAMEDLGYVVEGAVLEATAMGFATCWVGGVFSRASAASAIGLRPGELVPAVIALGRPAGKRSLADRIVTGAAKSRTRKPAEALFFPVGGSRIPETWNPVLEAVRIAPSASNKQPWRLVFDGRALLFLDEDKVYNNSLGAAHLQNVDMGIAMRHFADAASSLITGLWVPPEEGEAYRFGAAKGWTPIASWR